MRALAGRCFQHAGAQTLTAHFHQAKARNAADLNTGAIVLQRLLHRLLDLADVGVHLHVDEVDDDQARHVAQAQLAGDFTRGFQIGGDRGLLDAMFAGRPARVDVDRHQSFGRVDHQIAAGLQLHDGVVHCRQLVLDAGALEQRHRVGILLHAPGMARHQQLHEVLGGLVAMLALDDHFLDILVVDIADRPLDEVAVVMDQLGRGGAQRLLANLVPQPREIVEVALDLGLGALQAGGAHDAAHRRRQRHFGDDRLQPLAIGRIADLARNAATMAGVGHQHAIATGQRQIGGQRRALVAALFLDDLHQQHLAALDDVLDLVATAQRHALAAQLVGCVVALFALAPVRAAAFVAFAFAGFGFVSAFLIVMMGRFHDLDAIVPGGVLILVIIGAQRGLFLGMCAFLAQQRLAIFARNLVIVGMDFAESEEAVAIATIIDEGRLERRLYAGDLGEVDIALELLVLSGFEVKFLDPVSLDDRDPGFFPVARIDQHTHCHLCVSGDGGRRHWAGPPRDSDGTAVRAPGSAREAASSRFEGRIACLLRRQGRTVRRAGPSTPQHPVSGPAWKESHASCSVNLLRIGSSDRRAPMQIIKIRKGPY